MLIRICAVLLTILALAAPAGAVDTGTGDSLSDARELIANEDWNAALPMLRGIVAERRNDPDALSLLAYVLRHTGDYANAEGFYLRALEIDPEHLGANEYLGELYVLTGALDKAQGRLTMVEAICGTDCEEYRELQAAIDAAP